MRQSWETMTSVSAGHIIQTPTQPVGSGRPQRESNPGPPHQESRALPQSYRAPLGISNLALKWLNSYLNNRLMSVSIENLFSAPIPVRFCVPQGSVLGPILYSMYTAPLCDILSAQI